VNEGEGVSGKKLSNRPVLKETLDRLDRGEAEGLIVTKLDRLARSTIDFLTIMERAEKKGWKLIVLDFNIDTSTPAGRMIATVMAGFAQFERERISERTREGLALKKARGAKLGKPSTVPNEVIAKVLEMKSKRLTLKEISQTLNEQEIPTTVEGARWHPTSIQRIIQRAS
jgi:DNA invertase Pin-like site-specific DNA recombinase